jgi:hypothetical protein
LSHKTSTRTAATTNYDKYIKSTANLLVLMAGTTNQLPLSSSDAASALDCQPKKLSECMVGGKINGGMFCKFKKRSYKELDQHLADMNFTNSLLHGEEERHA